MLNLETSIFTTETLDLSGWWRNGCKLTPNPLQTSQQPFLKRQPPTSLWGILYNPDFKPLEFEGFKKEAGLNAFTMSAQKWVSTINAIGFVVKSGRYGGTITLIYKLLVMSILKAHNSQLLLYTFLTEHFLTTNSIYFLKSTYFYVCKKHLSTLIS